MVAVISQNLMILGILTVLIQKLTVKSVIDLQEQKVFKIPIHAIPWHDFFSKRSTGDDLGALGDPIFIVVWSVNLAKPAV